MSVRDDSTARILAALPNVARDSLQNARRDWKPINVMRQVIGVEADRLIRTLHGELEKCQPEDLKEKQGQIQGIRSLLAAANAQGDT